MTLGPEDLAAIRAYADPVSDEGVFALCDALEQAWTERDEARSERDDWRHHRASGAESLRERAERAEATIARMSVEFGETRHALQEAGARAVARAERAEAELRICTENRDLINERAEQAEIREERAWTERSAALAALDRVRALTDRWKRHGKPHMDYIVGDIRAAINGGAE